MRIAKAKEFSRRYQELPARIKKKVDKQIMLLSTNLFYPSLRTKHMSGTNWWEARIDKNYRMTFEKQNETIILRTVGPHDEGLGKK